MTTYQDIDWNSLDLMRNHLYRRLATPLTHALGRLAIAQHLNGSPEEDSDQEQFRRAGQGLEVALNLIKAWSALIHVKNGAAIQPDQRRLIAPSALPVWLVETLNMQTAFKAEHTRPVFVHPETFYESLILISEIAVKAGTLKMLLMGDAQKETAGVWVRAVFDPPPSGVYAGLRGLITRLDVQDPIARDVVIQIQVLEDLCAINQVCLKMQTNTDTGEQALAVQFPTAPADAAPSEPCKEEVALILAPLKDRGVPITSPKNESAPETLIVPPPGLRERLAAAINAAPSPEVVPADSPAPAPIQPAGQENTADTLIVPPPDLHKRLAAALDQQPSPEVVPPVPDERTSETLVVPPPDLRKRLTAATSVQPSPAAPSLAPTESAPVQPATPENASDTLIVPPANLRKRLNAAFDAETQPEAAPPDVVPPESVAPASPAPEAPPAPAKSAGVEIVAAENGSDTQIILPPDVQRRLIVRKRAAASNPPKDETPPAGETPKNDPQSAPGK